MNQQHDKKDASRALKPWKSFEGNIADNVKQCNIVLYVVPCLTPEDNPAIPAVKFK